LFAICCSSSRIFSRTYGETCAITLAASESAAFEAFARVGASTWIVTSGERFFGWPAVVTMLDVTFPRSCPRRMSAARAAFSNATSERIVSLTVLGFVARLWIWPAPPGVNGWPRYSSVWAL